MQSDYMIEKKEPAIDPITIAIIRIRARTANNLLYFLNFIVLNFLYFLIYS
jgi:hypothetical protein